MHGSNNVNYSPYGENKSIDTIGEISLLSVRRSLLLNISSTSRLICTIGNYYDMLINKINIGTFNENHRINGGTTSVLCQTSIFGTDGGFNYIIFIASFL